MARQLDPIKQVRCTYKDCPASFDTESQMRSHKKNSPEHDYCSKCREDFDSYEDLVYHKIKRPDAHNKACRVCGDEFKSDSGLKRHIEICHKVDQKLKCMCGEQFYRACLLVEHWEFGHCERMSASEFVGRIVHKHLLAELLKGGINKERFDAKVARFQAAVDTDSGGGVTLLDDQDTEVKAVEFAAIEPEIIETPVNSPQALGPYPPLPPKVNRVEDAESVMSSHLTDLSLDDHFKAVMSGQAASIPSSKVSLDGKTIANGDYTSTSSPNSIAIAQEHPKAVSNNDAATLSGARTIAAWTNDTAKALFPDAKPTIPPSDWSVQKQDKTMEEKLGLNIMQVRFWDPASKDWLPERFYDTMLSQYHCPFVCAQKFDTPGDLSRHILDDHRITSMRCPRCLDTFRSCTALVAHCESGSRKCNIRKADDFGTFLDRLTGGFLGVQEQIRPDHMHNPTIMVIDPTTKKVDVYKPPVASYLKYEVTKPSDYETKDEKVALRLGGQAVEDRVLLN